MSKNKNYAGFLIILIISFHTVVCAPMPQMDDDSPFQTNAVSGGTDYNTVMSHFKDMFMYFPVMMSTLKDTMAGFPQFAKGIRILTAKTVNSSDEDCKCKHGDSSNEIDRFR